MNKSNFNKYHREYQLKRYHKRRQFMLDKFGNMCAQCGGQENLEIDHIDRTKKSFSISKFWAIAQKQFLTELDKCQLLCRECHSIKTILELGKKIAKGNHGTISTYRYCHCDLCKKAKRDYLRKYRARKKQLSA